MAEKRSDKRRVECNGDIEIAFGNEIEKEKTKANDGGEWIGKPTPTLDENVVLCNSVNVP